MAEGPNERRGKKELNLERDKRLNIQLRLDFSSAPTGEARQAGREDIESLSVTHEPERPADTHRIMEEVSERKNLKEALRQVRSNKGSAGVDGMTVDKLGDYLKLHWPVIREQLLNGIYEPKPARRVEIQKPDGGGVRKLGRVGVPRTPLCSLCGRLQYLRSQRTRGSTGDGEHLALHLTKA